MVTTSPTSPTPVRFEELTAANFAEAAHAALRGSYVHTILEWTATCAAILVAVLSFVQYTIRRDASMPVIGVALLCAGSMDAFHTLAADRLIYAVADNRNLIPFTWAICRLFNALILALGVGMFVLHLRTRLAKGATWLVVSTSILFIAIAFGIIEICATTKNLPQTMFPDAVFKRPYDLLALVPYVMCLVFVFPQYYRQYRSQFAFSLILSALIHVAVQCYMAFGSFALFDSCFNIAHALKAAAYAVPVGGLLVDYIATCRQHETTQKHLTNQQSALEKHTAEAYMLNRVSSVASEAKSLSVALQGCLDCICESLNWPVGHTYIPADDGTHQLKPTETWHLSDEKAFARFRENTEQTALLPAWVCRVVYSVPEKLSGLPTSVRTTIFPAPYIAPTSTSAVRWAFRSKFTARLSPCWSFSRNRSWTRMNTFCTP